jgi:hypothetical protein
MYECRSATGSSALLSAVVVAERLDAAVLGHVRAGVPHLGRCTFRIPVDEVGFLAEAIGPLLEGAGQVELGVVVVLPLQDQHEADALGVVDRLDTDDTFDGPGCTVHDAARGVVDVELGEGELLDLVGLLVVRLVEEVVPAELALLTELLTHLKPLTGLIRTEHYYDNKMSYIVKWIDNLR